MNSNGGVAVGVSQEQIAKAFAAEQAHRDRLVRVEAQLDMVAQVTEEIRRELARLSKGLGVY